MSNRYNSHGTRTLTRRDAVAVIERYNRNARERAEAVTRGELPCWSCYTLFPIGALTCPACGAWVGSMQDNKLEVDRCESCGVIEGTRHNPNCG